MRPLPPLVAAEGRWVLPMADRSAALLAEGLLAEPATIPERLAGPLACDPPLVLWGVCVADRHDGHRPRSLADLAEWLARRALEVLQWDGARYAWPDPPDARRADRYADRVAQLLQTAEVAALLAAPEGRQAAEEAFLLGLLHDAPGWLVAPCDPEPAAALRLLPAWLTADEQTPAARRVREAADLLGPEPPEAPREFDVAATARRASEARAAWLEPLAGIADHLPTLAARLARLEALQRRFQETLETEKLESLAEFAAGAGHEINNPLAIIGGRAQLLLEDETDPERRRELAVVNAQVKRAHEMIADMRLFARPPVPEPETVELVALVDALVADLSPQAAERAVALSRTGDDGPLEIEADPAQLQVALRALCRNAVEAIGHDGHVTIALRRVPGHVEIRVADDGPGIPPEQRRHLFDPFYSARQAGRGLGFGLSKCWRIVTNHHGRIHVAGHPAPGATFTITLPQRHPG